jgi:hypothetical protein
MKKPGPAKQYASDKQSQTIDKKKRLHTLLYRASC